MAAQGTQSSEAFANRLRKNARHFHKWANSRGLTAYRLYDRDIPEFAYDVDWYAGRVQVTEYARRSALDPAGVVAMVGSILDVSPELVFLKTRSPKVWGKEQYERLGRKGEPFVVEEQGLKFWVDLSTHLDTGLFLDHRLTRARVREESLGRRCLNLFAYTGSFSVYAAAGGASSTTSVDLSKTYLDWAARNLRLNGFEGELIRADAREWVAKAKKGAYDLIVLDPPSFSTSKAMRGTFDVQRDHPKLIRDTLDLLAEGGVLYFSTNFRGFDLAAEFSQFEELTPRSIPDDFRRKDIHRSWRVICRLTRAGPVRR